MKKLYSKEKIGTMELKNRWIMLAIHTGFSDNGFFSDRDIAFYRRRAKGGMAAITLVGGVSKVGGSGSMNMLDEDKYDEKIMETVEAIHEGGCKVIMQLYHSGRNNTIKVSGFQPIAPSPVPSPIYKETPKEMTEEDIKITIDEFVSAAVKCKRLGVDCIEVSLSVGYLLSEFLSPITNLRNDYWGGDEQKRMRFPTEVLKSIRKAVGDDYPIIIKISGGDMLGGYDCDYMARFINQLPKGTIDGVTVTGGWHEAPVPQISYHVSPGHYAYLAKEIKEKTGLKVIACNRINNPETAETLLESGACDFAGAARAFIADPDFATKAQQGVPYNMCQGCNKCLERTLRKKDVRCAFNPIAGNECSVKEIIKKKNILVAGSGPAGLEAAYIALKKGHNVTVVTKENKIGGKLFAASKPPFKAGFIKFAETKEYELNNCRIITGEEITIDMINKIDPDSIIIAVGSDPIIPDIEGLMSCKHSSAEDILVGKSEVIGNNIVIIGGGSVGLETAEYISANTDKKVTVVEKLSKIGNGLGSLKWIEQKALKELNVEVICDAEPIKVENNELLIEVNGAFRRLRSDSLIFAVGYTPRRCDDITDYLTERGIPYYLVGDCNGGKTIMEATSDAFNAVNEL